MIVVHPAEEPASPLILVAGTPFCDQSTYANTICHRPDSTLSCCEIITRLRRNTFSSFRGQAAPFE